MTTSLRIAVVGHANTGKTSLLQTLLRLILTVLIFSMPWINSLKPMMLRIMYWIFHPKLLKNFPQLNGWEILILIY